MPELPEVEVVRRGLETLVAGHTIVCILFSNRRLRLPVPRAGLRRWAQGVQVNGVRRRAKYLIVDLDNQARLVIHLGMTGRLGIFSPETPRAKHDHLRFVFENGMELRYNDTRRFGSIQVVQPGRNEKEIFVNLGPEPFADEYSVKYLESRAARRNQPVKNFLMDNRVVVGIGNIYASEILHEAGISPLRPVSKISITEWRSIVTHSRNVLTRAIAAGGTTIADFIGSDGSQGYFQLELKVYGRQGKRCKTCRTVVSKSVLGGRASFWCSRCQK